MRSRENGIEVVNGTGNEEICRSQRVPRPATAGRARNMRAIRRSDTKPEVAIRSALHRRGFRFRKDFRLDLGDVKVRPDVVFTSRHVAVFVDGCFWHSCPQHGRPPASNEWYWAPKLRRTVERDRAADVALSGAGWTVVRVWEHEPVADAIGRVVAALDGPTSGAAPEREPR
ncbi:very short patch repair endonuclease [Prescottella equi]|nr:very short patch repair endonuclease [Prescottella equi]